MKVINAGNLPEMKITIDENVYSDSLGLPSADSPIRTDSPDASEEKPKDSTDDDKGDHNYGFDPNYDSRNWLLMKTLKKSGTFKRVPDSNKVDIDKIKNLLKEGWNLGRSWWRWIIVASCKNY